MQLKNLNLLSLILIVTILFTLSCNSKKTTNKENNCIKSDNLCNRYLRDDDFDSEQFLLDNKGPWVCYKYLKDTVRTKYPSFEYNEDYAKEISRYYYFSFSKNTLIVNDQFKIPISCVATEVDTLVKIGLGNTFKTFYLESGINTDIKYVYRIKSKESIRYQDYCKERMEGGDTIPYYDFINDPIRITRWCFSDVMAIYYEGYNYYFKKGIPNNNNVKGIPSDMNNRFEVIRTYSNCTIKEAAYKLIEEFPEGTMGLLFFSDEPNENGEMETWFPEKSGFNYGESTECIWKDQNNVTIKVFKHKNCLFVFEFEKQENDVHVKYWNDVVFPFEEGYKGN